MHKQEQLKLHNHTPIEERLISIIGMNRRFNIKTLSLYVTDLL